MEGISEGALCFEEENQKLAAWTDSSCQELFLDEPCPLPPVQWYLLVVFFEVDGPD